MTAWLRLFGHDYLEARTAYTFVTKGCERKLIACYGKGYQCIFECAQLEACIEHCPQEHIAADAGVTVKICNCLCLHNFTTLRRSGCHSRWLSVQKSTANSALWPRGSSGHEKLAVALHHKRRGSRLF